jgi:hypothetical protein
VWLYSFFREFHEYWTLDLRWLAHRFLFYNCLVKLAAFSTSYCRVASDKTINEYMKTTCKCILSSQENFTFTYNYVSIFIFWKYFESICFNFIWCLWLLLFVVVRVLRSFTVWLETDNYWLVPLLHLVTHITTTAFSALMIKSRVSLLTYPPHQMQFTPAWLHQFLHDGEIHRAKPTTESCGKYLNRRSPIGSPSCFHLRIQSMQIGTPSKKLDRIILNAAFKKAGNIRTYNATVTRCHVTTCREQAVGMAYSEWVPRVLVIRYAKCMRPIVLSSAASLAPPYFSALYHKRYDFREKAIGHKTCVLIFSTTFM